MTRLLDEEEISQQIAALDDWAGGPTGLRRVVKAADFPTAIRIVDEVAVVAEEMNHHPDIDIRWRTLYFTLVTHSAGGVTKADLALARHIDEIVRRHPLA